MSAPARPPEGGASSLGEEVAQRQEGSPVIAVPQGLAPRYAMRPMETSDLGAVMAIEQVVFPYPWSQGNFADSLKAGYSAWVCHDGLDLVGYAVFMVALDEAHLLNISVAPAHQGQGIGARLLRWVMDRAVRAGASRLLLEVRPSNASALRLYEHFGFVRIGVRRGYYPAPQGREDALVLSREIGDTWS